MSSLNPVISVEGSHYDCGFMHGEQCRDMIQSNISYYLNYWSQNMGISATRVRENAETILRETRRYAPHLVDELQGVADGSHSDINAVAAINGRYELAWGSPKQLLGGCTCIAATPQATNNGGTLLAQNWDYRPGVKQGLIVLDVKAEGKPRIVMHTEAGIIGHKGMNSHGLGILLNAMVSDRDHLGESVPFFLVCRHMLEAETLEAAVGAFLNAKRTVSYNVMAAMKGGVAVDLEAHPEDVSVITPRGGVLAHTNHFIGSKSLSVRDEFVKMEPSSVTRLLKASSLLEEGNGQHTPGTFRAVLRDHFGYPKSICYHPDPVQSPVLREETLCSVLMELDVGRFHYTDGPPCVNPYKVFSFTSLS